MSATADNLTDVQAEREYLSAVLFDPATLETAPVDPSEMSVAWHATVLTAMRAVVEGSEPLDTTSLRYELLRHVPGGDDFEERVLAFSGMPPVTSPARIRARIRSLAADRDLEHALASALVAVRNGKSASVREALFEIATVPTCDDGPRWVTLREAVESAIEAVIKTSEGGSASVPSGIAALDSITSGHYPGDLTVLGADTGVGKSSTMLLAAIAQAQAGRHPGIISVEDPAARWGQRILASFSGVPVRCIQKAELTSYQWTRITAAAVESAPLTISLAFEIGGTVADVTSALRRLVREQGCDIIYVDYLQAIEGGSGDRRLDQIRSIIAAIKRESNRPEACVPVVLGSQLKRRPNTASKPRLSDLYESGYIEQKAETIVMLWRDEHNVINATLAKAKDAPTGAEWVLERDSRTGLLREPSADEWSDEM